MLRIAVAAETGVIGDQSYTFTRQFRKMVLEAKASSPVNTFSLRLTTRRISPAFAVSFNVDTLGPDAERRGGDRCDASAQGRDILAAFRWTLFVNRITYECDCGSSQIDENSGKSRVPIRTNREQLAAVSRE